LLGAGFCVFTVLVSGRLAMLQIQQHEQYSKRASRQQTIRLTLQPERGDMLDRHGDPLATSTGTLSVYINPTFFQSPEAEVDLAMLARQVATYSDLTPAS